MLYALYLYYLLLLAVGRIATLQGTARASDLRAKGPTVVDELPKCRLIS